MVIPIEKWKWHGRAAHCCIGQWCRFHLATTVGKYLISTIGEYVHPGHSNGSEQAEAEWIRNNWPGEDVGCDRKYETMVFLAGKRCRFPECGCGIPALKNGIELAGVGYNTAGEATKGHMRICRAWAKRD